MATTRPEKRLRKKKKPPKKFRLSYSLLLLFAMIVVGTVAGLVAYKFGKQALEGVNPSPSGIKLPKTSPAPKPKESPKSQDGKTSFLLDESEVIAEMKARSQQELGGLTRPNPVAKANISDRKIIYARVNRVYNSMRDPLAISANADERIAARIAELRQRVYISSRSYESFERPVANNASNSSLPLLSSPIETAPIHSRWEDRDSALLNPRKGSIEDLEVLPKPTSSFFIPDRQMPSNGDGNRR
ncbi:MAG: hypothetical protein DCF19_10995 [Pseudanabaena frigida]|uniref:Uncharacterized protein n=1 Tax=Pseudanabaena frigida TaxID=945775 RepID=A0A2W4WFY5_9CYAN|nr:MAG: hypothetical protein DCF19_10995 [Pseudanabaena frigida]